MAKKKTKMRDPEWWTGAVRAPIGSQSDRYTSTVSREADARAPLIRRSVAIVRDLMMLARS